MVLGVPVPDHLAAEGQLVEDATRRADPDKVVADWTIAGEAFLPFRRSNMSKQLDENSYHEVKLSQLKFAMLRILLR